MYVSDNLDIYIYIHIYLTLPYIRKRWLLLEDGRKLSVRRN